MSDRPTVEFKKTGAALERVSVLLAGKDLALGRIAKALNEKSGGAIQRAADAVRFTGAIKTALEIPGPAGVDIDRLILIGVATPDAHSMHAWAEIGARAFRSAAGRETKTLSIVSETAGRGGLSDADVAAELAFGALMASYSFKRYMTKSNGSGENGQAVASGIAKLVIHTSNPDAAAAAFVARQAVAEGVCLARDLVNEPANILEPVEFARRAANLAELGVEIEILEDKDMEALGMGALLGVAQGSSQPARLVVMQWMGGKSRRTKPVCLVGKGVCFDTGGISMKPPGGMEDMKGDMGGAAAVVGTMHALASRKAAVNVIGVIGLVENMASAMAQRPGDIVTSMSGQTIEVINTDAEGRLVLADAIWYAQERFKPKVLVDLATLTGAIIVALGKEHAGLFTNSDRLASDLSDAGEATGEKVWRMPLGGNYDKLLKSRFADMKNIGGRLAGSVTAAQFIQRFVKDTDWAHLDIAGTAMGSPKTDLNDSWGSGWGVQILNHWIADKFER